MRELLQPLKRLVHFIVGKLGYAITKLPKEAPPPSAPQTLVRTVADFSTSPIELYVRKQYDMFRTGHFDSVYPEWRVRRIRKVIDLYGTDFKGKRIVELGGGSETSGRSSPNLGPRFYLSKVAERTSILRT
jgi:hypothetical protein